MKKLITLSVTFCTAIALSTAALAAVEDMALMKPANGSMGAMAPDNAALTDAVVRQVDPSTGMVTLQHGKLKNIGMAAMTMAYKAKDTAMIEHIKEGDKVKVRVENVDGTPTIVTLMKR